MPGDKRIQPQVVIDFPLYQSEKGNYFIGQTPFFSGEDGRAIAALINPSCSNVNIYVNAITITNTADLNLTADFYLKSSFTGMESDLVSCVNTSIIPAPLPNGHIQYVPTTNQPPNGGVAIFSRVVNPFSTLVVDGGQIILGPGQSLLVYLGQNLTIGLDSTKVAFGWSEVQTCKCPPPHRSLH